MLTLEVSQCGYGVGRVGEVWVFKGVGHRMQRGWVVRVGGGGVYGWGWGRVGMWGRAVWA